MEDTLFTAVLIAVILGAAFLALSRNRERVEEWEREFYRSESGGGGTPYQPLRAHQRKYVCNHCNLPFLFITFEEGPSAEPTCPFCHAKEARRYRPADDSPARADADELAEADEAVSSTAHSRWN